MSKHKIIRLFSFLLIVILASAVALSAAYADNSGLSTRGLQQAMNGNKDINLFGSSLKNGFSLDSAYYLGTASGINQPQRLANFSDEQKLYALLIDGRYDFFRDNSSLTFGLHPYISGGIGVAATGQSNYSLSSGGAQTAPLFRVGGGVSYRMDKSWNMSLDYNAGHSALSSGDQLFTGRTQQSVDLQSLNLGMHYAF